MFLIALLKMVMEKKNAMKRDLCRMVVGVEYRECSRNLIAVWFDCFSSFWDLLGNDRVGGGFIVVYEKKILAGMEVAFFGLVSL